MEFCLISKIFFKIRTGIGSEPELSDKLDQPELEQIVTDTQTLVPVKDTFWMYSIPVSKRKILLEESFNGRELAKKAGQRAVLVALHMGLQFLLLNV